jgi:hypothetical protein
MKMNRKILTGVLGGCALVTSGCDTPPPQQTDAELSRELTEIHLIGPLNDCLKKHPLSDAQKDYLLGMHSEYARQHYLMAMATDDAAAECQLRALQVCESLHPGDCIATPEEVRGRR